MIIFLYGADSYRLRQNQTIVIDGYKAKHSSGLNLITIDSEANLPAGKAGDVAKELDNTLKTISIFDEVRLIVVKDIFDTPETATKLMEVMEQHKLAGDKKNVVLAIHHGTQVEAKPKDVFEFLSQKPNLVREFKPLDGVKLEQWLKGEAVQRQAPLTAPALRKLLAFKFDSASYINTLDKLAAYCQGSITPMAVDLLVKTELDPNIFEFIDALGNGRTAQALQLLYTELANARDPYYLLSMIVYQYRTMLMVKDASLRMGSASEIAKAAGVHPFVASKTRTAVARLSLDDLKRSYQQLQDLELDAKNGLRDLTDGLYSLVLN